MGIVCKIKKGNFMKNIIKRTIKSLFMIFLGIIIISGSFPVSASEDTQPKILDGKTISILGDSISTYENISSGVAADTSNSTIRNNRVFYSNNKNGVSLHDTWWMQITDKLGGKILVNNSYSNSQIFDPDKNAVSQAYLDRAQNLHDNTGLNDGQKPDIIIVYMGYNDLAYCRDKTGTFDEVNLEELIKPIDDAVYCTQPQTTIEAYCIMIHKIQNAYPDAEIYCYNLAPRSLLTDETKVKFDQFNSDISKICERFNCILVDNYSNSGLSPDDTNVYCYLADGLHPNRNGMDATTNSFLKAFYENSRYRDTERRLHPVSYELDNVIVDQGTLKTVPENDSFFCSFSSITGAPIDVQVFIDDIDYTGLCYKNGCVNIPRVSGEIKVVASLVSENSTDDSYRFTLDDDSLKSVIGEENFENTVELNNGYISDNIIYDGSFSIEKTIELMHNTPWSVVWKAQYIPEYNCLTLSNYYLAEKEMNSLIHFINNTSILCMSEYKNGQYTSYGIDLAKYNIDITADNEYRLSNIISSDGRNMIYVFVNGTKIGALNHKVINGEVSTFDTKWCNGKNFYYNHIGTADNTFSGCKLEFIQIWENIFSENHTHNYIYSNEYAPTCTESGYKDLSCQCGYNTVEITSQSLGHSPSSLLVDEPATLYKSGNGHIECTVCEEVLENKTIPQMTPAAPKITSLTNETEGIRIRWYGVQGADYFRIYRRGAGQKCWKYLGTTTELSYLDKTVTNNNYWRYTVRSCNEGGFGAYDATGIYTKFLSAPKITSATNTVNGITLKWTPIKGATRYYVYRNRVGLSNWTYLGSTTTTTFNDSKIKNANGVDYRYTVRAHYGDSNGYTSGYYSAGYILRRLSAPVMKTAVSYPTGLYINWSQIPGVTGYNVYRKTAKSNWVLIGKATPANAAYFDKTAVKGTKYTYTVKAFYNKTLSDCYQKGITCVEKY